MKALVADDYGPPERLTVRDVATPRPGPGQALVRVAAAAANPFDLKLVTGEMRTAIPLTFPYIPGVDCAGTVTEVGSDAPGYAVGDPVFGMFSDHGALAEYALFSHDSPLVAVRPDGLDPARAAAVAQVGLTAKSVLRAAAVRTGETVLVIGATGGVGMVAVPLLVGNGAHVVATARVVDTEYVVTRLGAAETIDYADTDTVDEVLLVHPDGVDLVIDLVNAGDALLNTARAVRFGGRLVSVLDGPAASTYGRDDLTITHVSLAAEPGDLDDLARRVVDGSLPVEIDSRYPLDRGAKALGDLATRHTRGKRVVTVDG